MDNASQPAQWLRNHHKTLKGLFIQSRSLKLRANEMKENVFKEYFLELDLNLSIKKNVVYPLLNEKLPGFPNFNDRIKLDEHLKNIEECANFLLAIKSMSPSDPARQIRFNELTSKVNEYLEIEEREIIPFVQTLSEQDQSKLHMSIIQERELLYSLPEYQDARPSVVQNPRGGEQMRKVS